MTSFVASYGFSTVNNRWVADIEAAPELSGTSEFLLQLTRARDGLKVVVESQGHMILANYDDLLTCLEIAAAELQRIPYEDDED